VIRKIAFLSAIALVRLLLEPGSFVCQNRHQRKLIVVLLSFRFKVKMKHYDKKLDNIERGLQSII